LEDSILQVQVLEQNWQIKVWKKKKKGYPSQKRSYKVTHKVSKLTNFPSSGGIVPEN
jgi:hypothetical protein